VVAGARVTEGVRIALRGVCKRFGDHVVLDALDLEVAPGETVAIIGPSGSGKSTLLRCANGLTSFDAGEITVGPHRLAPNGSSTGAAHEVRGLVGMVFQDFQLFPHLSALENITLAPRRVLGMPAAQASELALALLDRVGLRTRAGHWPRQLSGGQKQRVAIARALAMSPRGLLCDEITSALDPEWKSDVLAVLEALRKDGLTLLVVTHEIGFARRAADRVIVLADGRIVEQGPPAEVLDRPRTERARQFLSRVMT